MELSFGNLEVRDLESRKQMSPYLDWSFAGPCARAADLTDLRDLLQIEMERLGFRFFCCCSHVRPDRPPKGAIYLYNYPRKWLEYYSRERLYMRDPVFVVGRNLALPFRWSDPRFLMDAAAAHGLKHGVTIPLHGPGHQRITSA